jgi:GH35 family endo-1,4-beta-xylanase
MQAWLAGLIAAIIPKLLEYLWSVASKEVQEQLAAARIKEHIATTIEKYEKIILAYDEVSDKQGGLTKEQKDKLRAEKIKLEQDLFNGISKR